MKIYVASSWRNIYQPEVVRIVRAAGHEPYDFRNPGPGAYGFGWSEVDPGWKGWNFARYRAQLNHPRARQGFAADMGALMDADACLLVYPCGKSAHLELGWACGARKRTACLFPTDIAHEIPVGHLPNGPCPACGDLDGCHLPGRLQRDFEPELMAKMADMLLIGRVELDGWLEGLR
jgi:hypothetical protein